MLKSYCGQNVYPEPLLKTVPYQFQGTVNNAPVAPGGPIRALYFDQNILNSATFCLAWLKMIKIMSRRPMLVS